MEIWKCHGTNGLDLSMTVLTRHMPHWPKGASDDRGPVFMWRMFVWLQRPTEMDGILSLRQLPQELCGAGYGILRRGRWQLALDG